jgi:hypothetical protein
MTENANDGFEFARFSRLKKRFLPEIRAKKCEFGDWADFESIYTGFSAFLDEFSSKTAEKSAKNGAKSVNFDEYDGKWTEKAQKWLKFASKWPKNPEKLAKIRLFRGNVFIFDHISRGKRDQKTCKAEFCAAISGVLDGFLAEIGEKMAEIGSFSMENDRKSIEIPRKSTENDRKSAKNGGKSIENDEIFPVFVPKIFVFPPPECDFSAFFGRNSTENGRFSAEKAAKNSQNGIFFAEKTAKNGRKFSLPGEKFDQLALLAEKIAGKKFCALFCFFFFFEKNNFFKKNVPFIL